MGPELNGMDGGYRVGVAVVLAGTGIANIIRHRGSQRSEFQATDTTLLEPGDLLEVRGQVATSHLPNATNLARGRIAP